VKRYSIPPRTLPFLTLPILLGFVAASAIAAARGAETAASPSDAKPEKPKAQWLDPDADELNGTVCNTFSSHILGHDVSYRLYLPPGYADEPTRRYPVLYWLHGMNGTPRTGAEGFIPHLDAAIREKVLPPVIVVLPNGMIDSFYHDDAEANHPVESVIIKELIPHIDQTYRTVARREGRVIEGYSMGGYGAAHLGFKHPELFGTVVINAGALDAKRFQQVADALEHPRHWIEKNQDQIRGRTRIRIGVGDLDYLYASNREFHELLDRLNVAHEYEVVPGVKHSGKAYYQKLGTKVFEFHRKALAGALESDVELIAPAPPAKPAARPELPEAHWLDPDRREPNGTKYMTFKSQAAGCEVSFHLYLPPGYDESTQRYPVIYWLQGSTQGQINGALGYVPYLDEAIRRKLMPPVIVVMPNGMVNSYFRDSADGKYPVESMMIKDLIPYIDRHYRTIADRAGRLIEGFSMGGYGAAHLGFKYPELFGTIVANSGAVGYGNDSPTDDTSNQDYPEEQPQYLAEKNADQLRGRTRIRIAVGANDYLLPVNRDLHETLTRLKIEHEYEVVPDVRHSWREFYQKLGPEGFEFQRKALGEAMRDRSIAETPG